MPRAALLMIATAAGLVLAGLQTLDAADLTGQAMLEALKAGGYVVYLRHGKTDLEKADQDPVVIGDCITQRPLSDAGRDQARVTRVALALRGIGVDHVLSSPYCRALETSALAFPQAERAPADMLRYSLPLPEPDAARAAGEIQKALATPPAAGVNTVLVGHTSNLKDAAGIWPKKEGGAVVFRPDGHGGFTLIGTIDPEDFARPPL
jgi:phosphohistidine phosphatase SixA